MQKYIAVFLIASLLVSLTLIVSPSVYALTCKTYILTATQINNAYNNIAMQYPEKIALDEGLAEQSEWTLTLDYDVLQFTENQSACYVGFMIDNETDPTGDDGDGNAELRIHIYGDEMKVFHVNETGQIDTYTVSSWTVPITIKVYNENGHYYYNLTDNGSIEHKSTPMKILYPAYLHYKLKNTTVSSDTSITFKFCYGMTTTEAINLWTPIILNIALLGVIVTILKQFTR